MSEGGGPHASDAVFFALVAVLIGLLCLTAGRAWPRAWPALPVPYSGWVLVAGLLLGLANQGTYNGDVVSGGIVAWTAMDHSLIFAGPAVS